MELRRVARASVCASDWLYSRPPALPKAVDCERKTISKKPAVEDGGHCDNPVGERSFESLFGVSAVVRKAGSSEETAVRRPSAPWAGVNSLGRSLPDLCRGSFSGDVPAAEDPEKQRRRAAGRRGLAEATFQRPTCRSKGRALALSELCDCVLALERKLRGEGLGASVNLAAEPTDERFDDERRRVT